MILLLAVVTLAYLPSLTVPYTFDDSRNISANPAITDASFHPADMWRAMRESPLGSRPFAYWSFAVNWIAGGVIGFHLVNLLVHLVTTWLVFRLFLLWLGRAEPGARDDARQWAAFLAAALWSLSPIHVQAVTYIVQRMTSMMTMFMLGALLLVLPREGGRGVSSGRALGGALLAALAIMTKELAILIPAAVLLCVWLLDERGSVRGLLRRRALIAGALAGTGLLLAFVLVARGGGAAELATKQYAYDHVPVGARLWTFPRIVLHYASLLVWPDPGRLNIDPEYAVSRGIVDPVWTLVALVVLALALGVAVARARRHPAISLGILWFVLFLIPEHTFLQLDLVFDHHAYLPSIGLFLLVAVGVRFAFRSSRRVAWAVGALVTIALVTSSVWTWQRNQVWRDPIRLWTLSAERSPGKWRPALNLARKLHARGRYVEAEEWFREAGRRAPGLGAPVDELGQMLIRLGRVETAEALYHEAADRIEEPALAWTMIATIRRLKRDFPGTVEALRMVETLEPDEFEIPHLIGRFLVAMGRLDAAEPAFRRAVDVDPGNARVWLDLSDLLRRTGRDAEADEALARARSLEPGITPDADAVPEVPAPRRQPLEGMER